LGQGACGRTVLLRDPQISLELVCKKYSPAYDSWRDRYFDNFVREIRLLYQLHHVNVVRLFQHFIYEERKAGFILMEFVPGLPLDEYLQKFPERINELFLQAIEGFRHLEISNVLHRDIRPANILVRGDGLLKIIDLGFGKHIAASDDFDKSVTLNWWCELPNDFAEQRYDFSTEVYFVGKLFQGLMSDLKIESFNYKETLSAMCEKSPSQRLKSFSDVYEQIAKNRFVEIGFSEDERAAYVEFADAVEAAITKVSDSAKYVQDAEQVLRSLEDAYRSFMLETVVPDSATVTKCFIRGPYYYVKRGLRVDVVGNFIRLLKSVSIEKRHLILSNLRTRLDSIGRYAEKDDEIPF
jgi:eukaryotic-like serine/threonine-protein kinase